MKITREQAIKILEGITNKDDPYWETVIEDYYDEDNDDWPTMYDVLEAIGISKEEYKSVVGIG